MAKGRLLAKKRNIYSKKKLINKRKKKAKILILEPKTSNDSRDKYSK